MNRWSEEDMAMLREFYESHPTEFLAEKIGKSRRQIWNKATRLGLAKPADAQTKFTPRTSGAKELGATRLTKQGYLEVNVGTRRWPLLHREVWRIHHGEDPPEGFSIRFKSGDKTDCRIENLELIHRAELMRVNSMANYPEEMQELFRLKANLKLMINKRSRINE